MDVPLGKHPNHLQRAMQCQSNHPTLGGLDATWCTPFPTHSHAASSTFVKENHHVRRLLAGKLASHPSFCDASTPPKDFGSCRFVKEMQPFKGTRPDFPHCLRDGQACQRTAAIKSTVSDFCHWVGDVQPCQRAAASKGIVSNRQQARKECQLPQRAADVKGAILYACHRLWDGQTCQRAAANKGALPNLGHRCRYA